ncbi:latrophilin receptor-like protein A [Oculina patagonica]
MTYFLFAELRTYPGKKVMHLSCAMIAMQTVYFVSDPDVVSAAVCAVMGALLHYFILVVFLWMSVIAQNTKKTFSTLNVDLHNPLVVAERKKSYIHSCVLAWGVPLVAVGICVTLQLTNTGNVVYGNEDGCQLSLPARTFAVAFPVTALLAYNIYALIRTAVAIKQQGNMAAASQRRLPVIVLKMTVVMGIAWILGFVLAFYPTPYLEYPFVIINSCQGVLICVSFVFNKHVFTLYKQRFMTATNPEPAAGAADQQAGSAQQP